MKSKSYKLFLLGLSCCLFMMTNPIRLYAYNSTYQLSLDGTTARWTKHKGADAYHIDLIYEADCEEQRADKNKKLPKENYGSAIGGWYQSHLICGILTKEDSYDFKNEIPKTGNYFLRLTTIPVTKNSLTWSVKNDFTPCSIDIGDTIKNGWEKWNSLGASNSPVEAIITSYQDGWRQEEDGKWYYVTDETEKARYCASWIWIDGNRDGIAECYFFDYDGYLMTNVPANWEEYTNCHFNHNQFFNGTNADGAWYNDGADAVDIIFPDVAAARGIYCDTDNGNVYRMKLN